MEELIPAVLPRYCERDVFGFEIANTLSNASFWAAAFAAWRGTWRDRSVFWRCLVVLMLLVGLCSGLWHALRTVPFLVLDAAPLYLLVLGIVYRAAFLAMGHAWALLFVSGTVLGALFANWATADTALHVASRHGVAVLAFSGLGFAILRVNRAAGRFTFVAVAMYAGALLLKSIDSAVCTSFPLGTHWGWHLLGGAAAYAGLRALGALESFS